VFKVQNGHYQIVLHYYLPKFPDQHCLTLRGKAEILSVMCCNGIKVIFSLTRQLLQNLSVPHNLLQCKCETDACSGCFRPRQGAQTPSFAQAPPPVLCSHPRFFAKITQNLISLSYQILEKWANLQLPLNAQKPQLLQIQGGFAPLTPHQGLCSWIPLGAPLPDSIIGSRYRARHGPKPPNIED